MEITNKLGYAWRGRLDTNAPYPVEAWACQDCGALVETLDQVRHTMSHESGKGETDG